MKLDNMVDLDEERLTMLDALIRQNERVASPYNKKVKLKVFLIGKYVWKVILHMDRIMLMKLKNLRLINDV